MKRNPYIYYTYIQETMKSAFCKEADLLIDEGIYWCNRDGCECYATTLDGVPDTNRCVHLRPLFKAGRLPSKKKNQLYI